MKSVYFICYVCHAKLCNIIVICELLGFLLYLLKPAAVILVLTRHIGDIATDILCHSYWFKILKHFLKGTYVSRKIQLSLIPELLEIHSSAKPQQVVGLQIHLSVG